jgi:hypothetical protein
MSLIKRMQPSPSMLVAGVAVIVSLAGTAIAGPLATNSALNKAEKKQVNRLIKKAGPGLSVANADTVDGANAADLRTSSASNQNASFFALSSSFQTVASATITTHGPGRVLATGSASLFNPASGGTGACRVVLDGDTSVDYHAVTPDTGNGSMVIAVNHAVTRPAGTYTASLLCRAATGSVSESDSAINVYGLGA